ncbi:amidohydrolase family protein [Dickeya poaceiphila]|uniref:Amidohydrolase family protein n=1 Tax=Dickeya poaceiphila TaxID=568768 RepID=A0A5B8I2P8_9GAMM|nr:amidohydrolase family protein [Dickeya poaceiphila]QDX29452.1 amidohydrolase family protein [Dickeya poaceiphila]
MDDKLIFKEIKYLNSEDMCFEVGDIRIRNDRIVEVGPNLDVHDEEVVLLNGGHIILPGLINAHLHPSKEVYGSLLDSSPIDKVLDTVHKNNELEDPEGQYISSIKSIGCALRKGVTSFGIFTSRIESDYRAVTEVGVRCVINFCQSNYWAGSGKSPKNKSIDTISSEYFLAEKLYQNDLVNITPATASELSADDLLLVMLHDIAIKRSRRFTLHINEGSHQVNAHINMYSKSGIERLHELGVLDHNTTLIHASYLSDREIEIIKESKCSLVHCPVSNSFVGAGTMPAKKFSSTNHIGLGTDAAMVNPVNDLTFDALFSLYHHGDSEFINKIDAKSVLHMITFGGAEALGLKDTGKIQSGFKADLIIYKENEMDNEYINTPVSILKMINKENPCHVLIDGDFVIKENCFKNIKIIDSVKEYSSIRNRVKL